MKFEDDVRLFVLGVKKDDRPNHFSVFVYRYFRLLSKVKCNSNVLELFGGDLEG